MDRSPGWQFGEGGRESYYTEVDSEERDGVYMNGSGGVVSGGGGGGGDERDGYQELIDDGYGDGGYELDNVGDDQVEVAAECVLALKVFLTAQTAFSVWTLPTNRGGPGSLVYVEIRMLGRTENSCLRAAGEVIDFNEKFVFEVFFENIWSASAILTFLKEERAEVDLVQVIPEADGDLPTENTRVLLGTWSSSVWELLFDGSDVGTVEADLASYRVLFEATMRMRSPAPPEIAAPDPCVNIGLSVAVYDYGGLLGDAERESENERVREEREWVEREREATRLLEDAYYDDDDDDDRAEADSYLYNGFDESGVVETQPLEEKASREERAAERRARHAAELRERRKREEAAEAERALLFEQLSQPANNTTRQSAYHAHCGERVDGGGKKKKRRSGTRRYSPGRHVHFDEGPAATVEGKGRPKSAPTRRAAGLGDVSATNGARAPTNPSTNNYNTTTNANSKSNNYNNTSNNTSYSSVGRERTADSVTYASPPPRRSRKSPPVPDFNPPSRRPATAPATRGTATNNNNNNNELSKKQKRLLRKKKAAAEASLATELKARVDQLVRDVESELSSKPLPTGGPAAFAADDRRSTHLLRTSAHVIPGGRDARRSRDRPDPTEERRVQRENRVDWLALLNHQQAAATQRQYAREDGWSQPAAAQASHSGYYERIHGPGPRADWERELAVSQRKAWRAPREGESEWPTVEGEYDEGVTTKRSLSSTGPFSSYTRYLRNEPYM